MLAQHGTVNTGEEVIAAALDQVGDRSANASGRNVA